MSEEVLKPNIFKNIILIISIIVTIGGCIGFYLVQGQIRQLAIDVNTDIATANKANANTTLSEISDPQLKETSDKAIGMLYPTTNFQTLVTKDLQQYASAYGVKINSVSLTTNSNSTKLPTLYKKVKTHRLLVSVGSPVSYTKLLKFIKAIETNNPKMQITNLNLSNIHANTGDVTVEPITIEIYTR